MGDPFPMPISQIDPASALIVIDMQKGVVGLPTVHPMTEVIGRVARLARAFRAKNLPVVLVNVAGRAPGRTEAKSNFSPQAGWTELIPELEQQPSDYIVTKLQLGAFAGTGLEQILRRRGATQIVMAGVSTCIGVESTARYAYDHGFNVAFVVDAITDLSAESHRHSVEKIFPRIGETGLTDEVLALLEKRGP